VTRGTDQENAKGHGSADEAVARQLLEGLLPAVHAPLGGRPRGEATHSTLEGDPRRVAEALPGPRDVGVAGPDVPLAEATDDLGGDAGGPGDLAAEELEQLEEVRGAPRAHVEDFVRDGLRLEGEEAGLGDVAHMDEVPGLQAIFEHEGSTAVQEGAREDGGDAGIGVREGLAVAIDVEEAQGYGGQAQAAPHGEDHLLLIALVDCVDGRGRQWLRLWRGAGVHGLAAVR